MTLLRQHLIDPEICIRCNTCEEACPIGAISHNSDNYVVDAKKCQHCSDCIALCPTGAIDNWRMVNQAEAYSLEEQFVWVELPDELGLEEVLENPDPLEAGETEVNNLLDIAHSGEGGKVLAPLSASVPSINLYNRDKPIVATVEGNERITDSEAESDIRHVVLNFAQQTFPVLEGQSIGIIPPGEDSQGKPHLVRLYSVASPRDGEHAGTNNLSLTIKRVVYDQDDERVYGICSNYVCDLQKGDNVQVIGPFGATFLMPTDPQANIIMICTGTGSAPFRAMTEYRRRHMSDAPGELLLYFGARTAEELPYLSPLNKLREAFIDKQLVFSRLADRPKEYVQDRVITTGDKILQLLNSENTYIYICGLKDMEQGVETSFEEICSRGSVDWPAIKKTMRQSGRYHVETY